jgi:hypothetical protein
MEQQLHAALEPVPLTLEPAQKPFMRTRTRRCRAGQ